MSQLLEIFGRAITINTADLIWHWLNTVAPPIDDSNDGQHYQLNKAIELIAEKKTEAASECLSVYLFENPSCIYGRMAATSIYLYDNQLQEAINELNSVYMRQPNNTMALYALGYCYERLGKESEAIEFYQDCLKFRRYLQLPAQRLAAIYFKNNQLEKTSQQYQLLSDEYPDDISALVTLGHLYIVTGKFAEAIETFNRAILMHPDNFSTRDDYTDQLIAEGNIQEALEHLEDLLLTEPNRPDLLIKYADVLRMVGAISDAVSQYEQAVRMCPDFLEATIKLGTQYLQLEQDYLAAEQFNKAVEINDKIVDAYMGLAVAQQHAGLKSDALGTLSLAAAIQPNSSLLFSELAALHFKLELKEHNSFYHNDYSHNLTESVIVAHQSQIASHPHNPDLYYRLGILMMHHGMFSGAIELFDRSLCINPFYHRARIKLSVCLFQTGRQSDALECASFSNIHDKDMLELHYKTALLYCDKIKFASTMINFERHLENNFAHPDASLNISLVLQNLGLLDRTIAMWDNLADTASFAINSDYQF